MAIQNTLVKCFKCAGTGTVADGQSGSACAACAGTSYLHEGRIEDTIVATYLILDATDATEYNALSAANKAAYGLILSCGRADISVGTSAHTKLWNIFGEGTTTRTNLEALL